MLATYNTPMLDWNLTKKIGANTYFYLKDGLASIRNIVDGDETTQNTYDYKAFGDVQGSPTENVANRYRFAAREWESLPAMYDYRSRMYSSTAGRFMKRDLPLFMGIDANSYRYVGNRPVGNRDPFGFVECWKCEYNMTISEATCRYITDPVNFPGRKLTFEQCMRDAIKGYYECLSICDGRDNREKRMFRRQWRDKHDEINRMFESCQITQNEADKMRREVDQGYNAQMEFARASQPSGWSTFNDEWGNAYYNYGWEIAGGLAGVYLLGSAVAMIFFPSVPTFINLVIAGIVFYAWLRGYLKHLELKREREKMKIWD